MALNLMVHDFHRLEYPVNMEIFIDHENLWIFSWHFNCLHPIGLSGFSWGR